jgi:hypothetical protein
MYIKIKSTAKVRFNSLVAGEDLYLRILEIRAIDDQNMRVKVDVVIASKLDNVISIAKVGNVEGIKSYYDFESSNHFFTVAAKMVYDQIKLDLNLVDNNLLIMADHKYKEDPAVRPIRLTIPSDVVVVTQGYRDLVGSMVDQAVPRSLVNECYIIYLEEIYPDDLVVLEADPRVLIE